MVDFKDLTLKQLREIVRNYNLHHHISNFSTLNKSKLIIEMKKHLIMENGIIKTVMTPFQQEAPLTLKQKKENTRAYNQIMNNPQIKEGIDPEALKYYEENRYVKKGDDIKNTKSVLESLYKHYEFRKDKEIKDLIDYNEKLLKELESKKKKVLPKKKEKKEKKGNKEEKEVDPQEAIKKLQEMIGKKEEDIKFWNKKLKGSGMEEFEGGAKGYALHAVLINKDLGFEEAFKEAQHIIKKKKFFHRETKNQYRFRNIPKQKFEPKTFRSKKINENITLVVGKLKPEHSHLEGAGLFDWIKEKASGAVSAVKNYFKPREDYNNLSTKTINDYGNVPIKQLYIMRAPIQSMLNNIINFVSLGKWNELKQKYDFDKLFHLSLVARLENGKNIIMEKNEVVNISPEFKNEKDSETLDIPFNGNLTINQILNTARKNIGDSKFFLYDAFTNNCQFFIKYLLEGQGLYNQNTKDFLFQDLEEIYKGLPSYVPKVMKGATTMGAIVNKILGKGKDKIIMNPEDFIKEHKKLISLLRQFDDPKLLAEANEQAQELKKETGVDLVNKNIKGKGVVGSKMVEVAGGKDKLLFDLVHLAHLVYSKALSPEKKQLDKFFQESEKLAGREGKTPTEISQDYLIAKYQPMLMDYAKRYLGRGKKQKKYN